MNHATVILTELYCFKSILFDPLFFQTDENVELSFTLMVASEAFLRLASFPEASEVAVAHRS